jgi:hypothetical protein
MSEDSNTPPPADLADHRSRPHKLQSKVRPALPSNKAPWTLVYVARDGHVVIPIPDRPGQRDSIEHAGGVWDPDAKCWRFANAKARDAIQQGIDADARKAADTVRPSSHKLAPGLNLIGEDFWEAIKDLNQVARHKDKLAEVDIDKVKPATLIDYVKKTGVRAVLQWLLEQELDSAVIKAVTKQLDSLRDGQSAKGGRTPAKTK